METSNVFKTLSAIDCSEHIEQRNGLSYLSWAWAWHIVKSHYPDAFYTIYEDANGMFYHTDGRTCWVKTGVTIQGQEYLEYLPVMDFRNASIPYERVTSFDVNKTIQRSLTKACARHGLGLYVYAGSDLPEVAEEIQEAPAKKTTRKAAPKAYKPLDEETYWKIIKAYAEGRKTKTGGDYKTTWIETTKAGAEEIRKFEQDVNFFIEGRA